MAYLNHNLPCITGYIRNEYLFNHTKGHGEFTPCDIHSVTSMEKRVPLFEAFLENGVNWTRRPIHAFCWKKDAPVLPLNIHMYWDCFSPYIDVQRVYQYTLDWGWENKAGNTDTNFSEDPEHKCAHLFAMDDGNYFAYPNNRVIWQDDAWVYNPIKENPGYLIDQTIYSVENSRGVLTDNSYMTEFNEVGEAYQG